MDATPNVSPSELRAVILFDGHNWFKAAREYLLPERLKIDYPALVSWLVAKLRSEFKLPEDAPTLSETWYVTAIPDDSADFRERILGFLLAIERQGIRVERLHTRQVLVTHNFTCPKCNEEAVVQEIRYEEEQVDVSIAVKLVELSMRHEIDVAVLVSGDSDYIPAVVAAQKEGVRVYIASLPVPNVSPELVRAASGRIDMAEGLRLFTHAQSGGTKNGGDAPGNQENQPSADHGK